jgi:hypothetical protein
MYFSNGDRYDGEWKNDKMHGHGVYHRNDSMKIEAQFEEGFRYCFFIHLHSDNFIVVPFSNTISSSEIC